MNNTPINNAGMFGPSWYVGVLPFCEQRSLYDQIDTLEKSGQTFSTVSTDNTTIGARLATSRLLMLCPQ